MSMHLLGMMPWQSLSRIAVVVGQLQPQLRPCPNLSELLSCHGDSCHKRIDTSLRERICFQQETFFSAMELSQL